MAQNNVRKDRISWLAPALLGAGAMALSYAALHAGGAQDMNPGVEGAVTVGVLAPILLLLHGLRFTEMLKVAAPIWFVQLVATVAVAGPAVSGMGINLVVTGAIGILINVLASRDRAPVTAAPARRERANASLPIFARTA